ncbi:MAG: M20/M25/M40 family metallo-hydrolase [Acidobacteria bacterium]|nr:M20/M25/M40 family metallo-hydrolase [Acidobacteriota bacterium]
MRVFALCLLLALPAVALDDNIPLPDRARQYLIDLLKLDTTNPPGNETRVAEYLRQVADTHGISCELLGPDARRLNFVARLKGGVRRRPLLLIAHSDVVPVDRGQWTVDPFRGETRGGFIFGRGAVDDKSLLAAELAVLVELRRRNIRLNRDIILLSEADEEAGATGIQWIVDKAWAKIDAEFALNEGGYIFETSDGDRAFNIQTAEKVPTRVILTAHGAAGHGSLPRPDNPVLRLSRAVARLADSDQPVHVNSVTRRYLRELSRLPDFTWLAPMLPKLDNPALAGAVANQIRSREPEIEAMLRTSVTPTMLRASNKVNVIPNTAEAQLDVRRLPSETREEIVARFRQTINDPSIDVTVAAAPGMPATEPSPLITPLYRAMERVFKIHSEDVVLPYMSRGASDSSFLRARGMPVYGVPLFAKEGGDARIHGNDERISPKNLEDGVELLWQIVMEVAGRE